MPHPGQGHAVPKAQGIDKPLSLRTEHALPTTTWNAAALPPGRTSSLLGRWPHGHQVSMSSTLPLVCSGLRYGSQYEAVLISATSQGEASETFLTMTI